MINDSKLFSIGERRPSTPRAKEEAPVAHEPLVAQAADHNDIAKITMLSKGARSKTAIEKKP